MSLVEVIGPLFFYAYAILNFSNEGKVSLEEHGLEVQILGFYGLIGGILFWIHMMVKGFRDQGTFGFLWGLFILFFSFLGAFVYWFYLLYFTFKPSESN